MSTKEELRPKYKALRKLLSENDIEEMSLAVANKTLTLPIWEKTYFHIFLPITEHHEVNTEFILHLLSGKDKEIIVSKADFSTRNMTHFLLTDNTKIKKKINNIHGNNKSANHITIFANPCTMQIILLHFSMIQLSSHKKEDNKVHIKKFTKIGSYRAKQEQRDRLFTTINLENYKFMMSNCKTLPNDDTITGSSNFSIFLDRFSNNDTVWIDEINKVLQEEEFKIAIKK